MCPVMEGIHGAGTDCISGSHPNLTGVELLTSGENHIQNGGYPFLRQDGVPEPDETSPQHAVSNSQDTCWASAWDHSCHSPEGGTADYSTSRLQWQLKSSAWDFSMSSHAGPGSDVVRRTHASDWGTQDEGFILGGSIAGTGQKELFAMCSASSNGATSHFAESLGFTSAAVTRENGLLGSSCSPSDSEVKPCNTWPGQDSKLHVLNLVNTDSKSKIESGDLESIHSRMNAVENHQRLQTREQHSRMCLGNVQRDESTSVHVKEEVKLGDAEDAQNCKLARSGVAVGDASMGLGLGKRMYFEDATDGLTSRGQATSTLPVLAGSPAVKKQRILAPGVHLPRCQVEGCKADLSAAKDYHRRHKVCEMHSKAPKVIANGMEQRFCQQCSRFHSLGEFDESKRSCRRRLAGHNERRRKSSHDTSAIVAASIGQDHRSALSGILDRSCFMQHPYPVTPVRDEPDSRRGWPRYDKLDEQVTLACRMQVLNGGASIPHHAADRLLMMLQGPTGIMVPHSNKSPSSPDIHHHHLYAQGPSSAGQSLTLSPSTGPGVLASSLSSPGLSADSGRALSLLSSQSLSSRSNAEKFIGENHHHHSLSQGFANSHTCGATAQSGFAASGEEKLFGLSSTGVDHKEQGQAGSLMSGLGDPLLAQLLQGQDFRSLNSQQVRPTLDLMQLPSSHSHQMGIQDGNGGPFPELHSLRPYQTSIFGHQQLI